MSIPSPSQALTLGMFLIALIYCTVASFGLLTFGPLLHTDLLLSYDARRPEVLVAVILLAAKAWFAFPIIAFCVR